MEGPPYHHRDQGGGTGAGQLESFTSSFLLVLPARRRGDGRTARGAAAFAASDVWGHETRRNKALGSQTSADPGLAEVCATASPGFGPGPGKGMRNARPKHSAEERKQDSVGGEGEDVGLRENGGEALQRQAGSTRSPRCSLMLSRGWRQGSSGGESGRGKCFSSHFGVRAFPWIAGVPLKPCTSPLRTWVRSEGSWSPMLAAFGQALGTSAAWPLPHTEGTRAGAAGRAARKRGAQPAPWGASSA